MTTTETTMEVEYKCHCGKPSRLYEIDLCNDHYAEDLAKHFKRRTGYNIAGYKCMIVQYMNKGDWQTAAYYMKVLVDAQGADTLLNSWERLMGSFVYADSIKKETPRKTTSFVVEIEREDEEGVWQPALLVERHNPFRVRMKTRE